jgi:hypothetical protein
MKMVYLNGMMLAPDGVIASSNNDYSLKKGRLRLEFMLKRGDILAVVRTFLGLVWSRRYYCVKDYGMIPSDTPMKLLRGGGISAEGYVESKAPLTKAKEKDSLFAVS